MDKARKNLKSMSILVLFFTALSLVRLVIELLMSKNAVNNIPEGVGQELASVIMTITVVVGIILLIPQVYIGIKGIMISKQPKSSTGHIIWAKILFVLSIIAIIMPIMDIVKMDDLMSNIVEALDIVIDLIVYFLYIKYATEVLNNR